MLKEYLEVDNDGNIIEVHALNPEEDTIPANHFEGWGDREFFSPKWDFDKDDWVEGLSEEEVMKRKQEIEKSRHQPTDEELNAMAIMELGKLIMEGGL